VQWAATITDASMRDTVTVAALQAWFEADPTNAGGWIANAGLPDQIKARFLPPQD
jgi:hypothetical protein